MASEPSSVDFQRLIYTLGQDRVISHAAGVLITHAVASGPAALSPCKWPSPRREFWRYLKNSSSDWSHREPIIVRPNDIYRLYDILMEFLVILVHTRNSIEKPRDIITVIEGDVPRD